MTQPKKHKLSNAESIALLMNDDLMLQTSSSESELSARFNPFRQVKAPEGPLDKYINKVLRTQGEPKDDKETDNPAKKRGRKTNSSQYSKIYSRKEFASLRDARAAHKLKVWHREPQISDSNERPITEPGSINHKEQHTEESQVLVLPSLPSAVIKLHPTGDRQSAQSLAAAKS